MSVNKIVSDPRPQIMAIMYRINPLDLKELKTANIDFSLKK